MVAHAYSEGEPLRALHAEVAAYVRFQEIAGTGGSPSPGLFEWMMGFPLGWTDCED